MMKKIYFFLILIVLLSSFVLTAAGCGSGSSSSSKNADDTQDQQKEEIYPEGVTFSIDGGEEITLTTLLWIDDIGCFKYGAAYEKYIAYISDENPVKKYRMKLEITGDAAKKVKEGAVLDSSNGDQLQLDLLYKNYYTSTYTLDAEYNTAIKMTFVEWGGTGGRVRAQFEGTFKKYSYDGVSLVQIKGRFNLPVKKAYEE